jgi:hypothetical protein
MSFFPFAPICLRMAGEERLIIRKRSSVVLRESPSLHGVSNYIGNFPLFQKVDSTKVFSIDDLSILERQGGANRQIYKWRSPLLGKFLF